MRIPVLLVLTVIMQNLHSNSNTALTRIRRKGGMAKKINKKQKYKDAEEEETK